MDTTLDKEENAKNIYVIRRKLASIQRVPGRSHYEFDVGNFTVFIYTSGVQDIKPEGPHKYLTDYKVVDVVLNESTKKGSTSSISLIEDARFKNYEPIRYNTTTTPNGVINLSDGRNMPMLQLCELIRYLYRLSNLTAFI
jgi:hypothetical protein